MESNQMIGHYQVIQEIDRGGMATVYLAYDQKMAREVALKVLPQQFTHDQKFITRFQNEARILAKLEHFAIVPIYDYGQDKGFPFLVMRYMKQGSLTKQLAGGPLPIPLIARVLYRVSEALDKAHSHGIIHRDIKPSNILFDAEGNAYLSDFGIAKLRESRQGLTTEAIIGTPAYMSPEQADGGKEVDGRSDIYSLGIVLFEMMTHQAPFPAENNHVQQMMAHILAPVPSILDINPHLPKDFAPIVARAMDKDPENRYPHARDLAEIFLKTAVLARQLSPLSEDSWPGLVTTNPLPAHLQQELISDQAEVRAGAARKLESLLYAPDNNLLIPALMALTRLAKDENSRVARRATTHLDNFYNQNDSPVIPITTPSTVETTKTPEITNSSHQPTEQSSKKWQKVLLFAQQPIAITEFWINMAAIIILSVLVLVLGFAVFYPSPKPVTEDQTRLITNGVRETQATEGTEAALELTQDAYRFSVQRTQEAATAVARAQLSGTATAQAKATGTSVAMRANINTLLAQAQANHYEIEDHQLNHSTDDYVSTYLVQNADLENFVAEAQFFNPYSAVFHDWDIGFIFRNNPDDHQRQWRVGVSTNGAGLGYWFLDFWYDGEPVAQYSMKGDLDAGVLNTNAGGYNQLSLIAEDNSGYLLLNGYPIAQLRLESITDGPGNLQTGTGFFNGHEVNGYTTRVQKFILRAANANDLLLIQQRATATAVSNFATATAVSGVTTARNILQSTNARSIFYEETGSLLHEEDDFIEIHIAEDINLQNFITEAIFSNPYPLTIGSWDYGFMFRRNPETNDAYHLIILSDNTWELNLRQNDNDFTIKQGKLTNLDTTTYGRNHVQLIVENYQGFFFLNNQYIDFFDLNARSTRGEIAISTGVYNGNEVDGQKTDFQDFGVWPLDE